MTLSPEYWKPLQKDSTSNLCEVLEKAMVKLRLNTLCRDIYHPPLADHMFKRTELQRSRFHDSTIDCACPYRDTVGVSEFKKSAFPVKINTMTTGIANLLHWKDLNGLIADQGPAV